MSDHHSQSDIGRLRALPKAEVHVHLEGCFERLRRAGVPVSVNTDDPALLGASLEGEYALCRTAFGWSDDIVRAVAGTSIEASFANADIKARLTGALARW